MNNNTLRRWYGIHQREEFSYDKYLQERGITKDKLLLFGFFWRNKYFVTLLKLEKYIFITNSKQLLSRVCEKHKSYILNKYLEYC